MHALNIDHPETWRELEESNISVTKSTIPFMSIGADHACEHLNKLMKVHVGLIGISINPNARQRFLLAAPELSCLAKEFKDQFRDVGSKAVEHDDFPQAKSGGSMEPLVGLRMPYRVTAIHLLLRAT